MRLGLGAQGSGSVSRKRRAAGDSIPPAARERTPRAASCERLPEPRRQEIRAWADEVDDGIVKMVLRELAVLNEAP